MMRHSRFSKFCWVVAAAIFLVCCSNTGRVHASGILASAYRLIQDEGVSLTPGHTINFVGSGVTATNGAAGVTTVTIPGGGGGGGYATMQNQGTPIAQETVMNFVGAGVAATAGTGVSIVTIPGYNNTVQDEGTPLTQTSVIDFQGAGCTSTSGSGKTIVTIPGGGGGGGGVSSGSFASRPACTSTQFFYNVLNSPWFLACDGASSYIWKFYGIQVPGRATTSQFTFVNTGTAVWADDTTTGTMTFTQPLNLATPLRLAAWSGSLPSAPYAITAYINVPGTYGSGGGSYGGVYVRNTGTGLLETSYTVSSGTTPPVGGVQATRWNDPNNFGSLIGQEAITWANPHLLVVRMEISSTAITSLVSTDGGFTYEQFGSSLIAGSIGTIDEVGVVFANLGGSQATMHAQLAVFTVQ